MSATRRLTACTLIAVATAASLALPSAAEAKHHNGHRGHQKHAAKVVLVPAQQRPDYVGAAGYAGGVLSLPGLIDLGYGPVFPFGGWPKKL